MANPIITKVKLEEGLKTPEEIYGITVDEIKKVGSKIAQEILENKPESGNLDDEEVEIAYIVLVHNCPFMAINLALNKNLTDMNTAAEKHHTSADLVKLFLDQGREFLEANLEIVKYTVATNGYVTSNVMRNLM